MFSGNSYKDYSIYNTADLLKIVIEAHGLKVPERRLIYYHINLANFNC
jgi:hypothetical protein